MINDAEAGLVDVVVVHKLDRFSRNLMTTLDTLQRLEGAGVGFVSISEAMDFTTPIGKVILATLGAFAEYYSANLSAETRKGKTERKKQGLYNGVLPFGTIKGEDGIPVAHPIAHTGLVMAFELAASGKTDREVAQVLNTSGYRTTGNRGANPFTKDTVRVILRNRFYLGELPDGRNGHMPGKHSPVIDPLLFERAQAVRATNTRKPVRQGHNYRPWGLSGLATCALCGSPMTINGQTEGRRRIGCAGRTQGNGCSARSYFADSVESSLGSVLNRFVLPVDSQRSLLAIWKKAQGNIGDRAAERLRLERRLERLKDLYLDGTIDQARFRRERADLTDQLGALPHDSSKDDTTGERLAQLLKDVGTAWHLASAEERNRLARQLLRQAVVRDKTVIAVVPRSEMAPFFELVAMKNTDATPESTESGIGVTSWTEATGIEPAISALTGLHVNHYTTPPQRSR